MAEDAGNSHDVVVIGAGPGGYVAAIRAAQLGLRAAVVERERVGGVCLNWGCIPTKALLRAAELFCDLHQLEQFGLAADNPRFALDAVIARSRRAADRLADGVRLLLRSNGVEVITGAARLRDGTSVSVDAPDGARTLRPRCVIVATGARAQMLPVLEPVAARVWTYREALLPPAAPASLIVVGGGAIGMEFASFYRALGADVSVVEAQERILPMEDAEISDLAARAFQRRGMRLLTGAVLERALPGGAGATARVRTADGVCALDAEYLICAVGITGNVEDMGLEQAGVKIARGHVITDGFGRTSAPGVYAIGDVTGPPWLAHKASHEGVIAAGHLAGEANLRPLDAGNIPACTYTHPQVASVGLTQDQARAQRGAVRVGRFPAAANGKAIALGEEQGMIKTIFDAATGELLGAHMIGSGVTELIQGFALARTLEATEAEIMETVFPHPTLSEMMHESVLDSQGRALHIPPRRGK